MKSWKGLTAAAVAAALGTAPVAAAQAPRPATESVQGANALAEGDTATYVNIGILAALVVIVLVFVADGDSNDSPNSP